MWGRGNSWYTVAIMDYLEMVEIDEGLKRHFLTVYYDQVNALKKYADRDCGLWHTIINDNSSYIEISASAGFLCGILHGIRTGHLGYQTSMVIWLIKHWHICRNISKRTEL